MGIKLNSGIIVPAPTPSDELFWVEYNAEVAERKALKEAQEALSDAIGQVKKTTK